MVFEMHMFSTDSKSSLLTLITFPQHQKKKHDSTDSKEPSICLGQYDHSSIPRSSHPHLLSCLQGRLESLDDAGIDGQAQPLGVSEIPIFPSGSSQPQEESGVTLNMV